MLRRDFVKALGALALADAIPAQAATPKTFAGLRGSIDASQHGIRPSSSDDQSRVFQAILDTASRDDKPVFLPPGTYAVSNIDLPERTRLVGIAGTSRILYSGNGSLLRGNGCELIDIEGVTLDGANRPFADDFAGLLHLRGCPRIRVDQCELIGSMGTGISLEVCGGRVERSRISGAAGVAGLYSVNATGLSVSDNTVADCANGGILVHRWDIGADNTMVANNRVERIAARGGGTGQRGNGINLFRTEGVIVSGNHVSDCAFSAIRANSASNAQITGNTCLRSGETAVYSEFAFQGALIANNIIDGGTMGVSIANFNEGGRLAVCANNLIRNMHTDGPYPPEVAGFGHGIAVEADTAVTGNVVEGAPKFGMLLGWGPYLRNVVVSNNIVRRAGTGLAVTVVENAGTAVISNNLFDQVERGGIIGHRWNDPATRELVGLSRQPFAHLTVERNRLT
ncbi:MAG: TIGR03808 family TAT-translocated repetitive protein [Ahrensia sp.]|nr:TIGR03808 family TAT-translocated repetitive protein [Ahrensia sp.]